MLELIGAILIVYLICKNGFSDGGPIYPLK